MLKESSFNLTLFSFPLCCYEKYHGQKQREGMVSLAYRLRVYNQGKPRKDLKESVWNQELKPSPQMNTVGLILGPQVCLPFLPRLPRDGTAYRRSDSTTQIVSGRYPRDMSTGQRRRQFLD